MARPMTVCDSIVVAALPAVLYALVSDPTAVRRWSPENTGATVDTEGPQPLGATFIGTNKRGPASWTTRCTVIAAEPDTRFAFRVDRIGCRTPACAPRSRPLHSPQVRDRRRITGAARA